ncbi:beta-ketoacyl-[acyl-carrier-protein] synthase family protein [Streptomyces sp. NA04227]|uniref:beta-ketoacyl-[acyl-carrier-protein] synthase family protein n=1 Tax=Streptomyces sp. NA04227 TaxID=2742136 RepID=UPI0015922C7C|nr:beta-ketoacyl-[acyl-carrier-protein] synthase family protein [Streptomyces sp. NA04227]QKW05287.1 beta-ketoacyl-[acyl-carrier-protein] synthase family protein [Streptomyces sp. NA04227]
MPPADIPPFEAAITGIGMVTSAGIGTETSWENIRAAEGTAAARLPALEGIPADVACGIPDFDAAKIIGRRKAWRLDRNAQLALASAAEAIADSGLDWQSWDGARVGVIMGTGVGGTATWEKQVQVRLEKGPEKVSAMLVPSLIVNMTSGHIAMEYGARGPNFVTASACASGTSALGAARDLLRNGTCDIVIAGGAEAALSPTLIAGFDQMGTLSRRRDEPTAASRPFDVDRDGFVPAEGAAVLILEHPEHARARGARIRANIRGYGASADAYNATAPDPEGAGAELALRAALRDAGVTPQEVGHVNAHGTSTKLNDLTESKMIRRVLGDHPAVTSVKGVTGHALGAAGAIEAAVTALTLESGQIPPTANLESLDPEIELDVVAKAPRTAGVEVAVSNSFGFGGQNAILLMTRA